jgi:uncharacterized damage-inducible protein DinB
MAQEKALRAQLAEFLGWHHAHAGFDDVVTGVAAAKRGALPKGFAHSIWEIVEHMRMAQADILDFCVSKHYVEKKWPDDYWPKTKGPKNPVAWTRSLAAYRRDRKAMQRLTTNSRIDLMAKIPHGTGQTYLREILLVADHTAHHTAQIIDLRRALGIWK